MALTVTPKLTNITLAETTTGWTGFAVAANAPQPQQENNIYKQGSFAVSALLSQKNGGIWYNSGTPIDFVTTHAGAHIYFWVYVTTWRGSNTIENGGIAIRLGTTTTDWAEWYIGGSNSWKSGWRVDRVLEECGSGLNDNRPKLVEMLSDPKVTRVVVEHKDRLTRFGFNYIQTLFKGEIVVINNVETDEEDIIQDLTSIITSFCARIYGKRRSKRKTEQLIKELETE